MLQSGGMLADLEQLLARREVFIARKLGAFAAASGAECAFEPGIGFQYCEASDLGIRC